MCSRNFGVYTYIMTSVNKETIWKCRFTYMWESSKQSEIVLTTFSYYFFIHWRYTSVNIIFFTRVDFTTTFYIKFQLKEELNSVGLDPAPVWRGLYPPWT